MKTYLFVLCLWCLYGCNAYVENQYRELYVSTLDLPWLDATSDCKVFMYVDSSRCTECQMSLPKWEKFMKDATFLFGNKVSFSFCASSLVNRNTVKLVALRSNFSYPISIDSNDIVKSKLNIPSDSRFHCFLLDENNKVILIGNPVHNPKIKELYFKTISDRLGIVYNPQSEHNTNEIDFGTFSMETTKQTVFTILNTTQCFMRIDTVFSSCECTTAFIDQNEITPSESAKLSVIYTPDGTGDFYQEVYVKVNGEEKPREFKIRGNVTP